MRCLKSRHRPDDPQRQARRLKLPLGVSVRGRVVAFSVGEKLNDETAVIHVEKADPEYPQLFTVINQQFCQHEWGDMRFINREQDLGVPGLRKAKESYFPVRLVKKYIIQEPVRGVSS